MSTIDLKQLERRAFTATFQDGFWDLFIAVMALGFAVTPFINRVLHSDFWSSAALLPVNLLVLAGVFLGKKYLTVPRLGAVKYAPARVRKMIRLGTLAVILLSIAALIGFLASQGALDRRIYQGSLYLGLVLLVGFGTLGMVLGVIRFVFYGLLLSAALVGGEALWNAGWPPAVHHGWPFTFGIAGTVILVTGVTCLVRFLQSNPLLAEEVDHVFDS